MIFRILGESSQSIGLPVAVDRSKKQANATVLINERLFSEKKWTDSTQGILAFLLKKRIFLCTNAEKHIYMLKQNEASPTTEANMSATQKIPKTRPMSRKRLLKFSALEASPNTTAQLAPVAKCLRTGGPGPSTLPLCQRTTKW